MIFSSSRTLLLSAGLVFSGGSGWDSLSKDGPPLQDRWPDSFSGPSRSDGFSKEGLPSQDSCLLARLSSGPIRSDDPSGDGPPSYNAGPGARLVFPRKLQ